MRECAQKFRLGVLAAVGVSLLWGFQDLFLEHAPAVFSNRLEDMSYAWYVPLFSVYLIWRDRAKLLAACGESSWVGVVLIVPCLLLGFLGVRGSQIRFEMLAVMGLLLTVPWALYGARVARQLLVPIGFLLFCLPMASFLDIVTVHLRLLATSIAYSLMCGFGAEVVRQGSMILALDGSFQIDVAEPCSGLRSIFALMALTAGYAYLTQRTWVKRMILFATSVPLAIVGNVTRILTICLVANYASQEFATGFYHDYSGYVVFFVAIGAMVGIGEILKR